MKKNKTIKNVIAIVLIVFAFATIFMSSSVLFDLFDMRAKVGNYIPFVEKTNLTAGFLYLLAAYGFMNSNKWAFWAMLSIALLLFYAFTLSYVHIHTGGLFENRTVIALIFRILFTLVFAGLLYRFTDKNA